MVFYTLNQIINLIEQISLAHAQVNSFGFGEESSISASEQEAYPLVWLNLQPSTITDNTFSLSLSMLVCDIVKADDENERDALSDCLSIAQDLYAELTSPTYQDYFSIQYNVGISPVREGLPDLVNGFRIDLVLDLEQIRDRCQIPFISGLPGGEPVCSPAVVTLNGDSFLVVNSGATTNVTLIDENGDEVTPVSVVGSVIELPPTGGGNATVTLMGDAFLTIPSGDTENILIQDASDSNIDPSSVTGNIIKYNINIKPHFSVAPVLNVSGNQNVGTVITCGTGTVLGVPTITYSYQWKRDGVNFVNVGNQYTAGVGDIGTVITCLVTPTNDFGSDSELTSNSVTVVASSLDPDAEAFLTAAGITDPTITDAINDLVVGMKSDSIWAKMYALYPFVGGSASTHKWNLKEPIDTDAAYRLTFHGGITHDANGITPNGTNGYCETYIGGDNLVNNDTSWSFYSRTDVTDDGVDLGGADGSGNGVYAFTKRTFGDFGFISNLYAGSQRIENPSMPSSTGLIGASRINSTSHNTYRNGAVLNTTSALNVYDITTMSTHITLCAYRASDGGTPILHSVRNLAFAHLGTGLTDTDFANLYTLVLAFETALSRNV